MRHEGVYRQLCCTDDGGRPTEIVIQVKVSNYLKVLWSKAMVLSVKEKAVIKNCQVSIKEMKWKMERLFQEAPGSRKVVITPVVSNHFLHYVYDDFIVKEFPSIPWARYADDYLNEIKQ